MDIFFPDIIHKYIDRLPYLNTICLANFASSYNVTNQKCTLIRKQKIIKCIKYNKYKDPDNYYREQCSLFLPFIDNEQSNIKPEQTWNSIYELHKRTTVNNASKYTRVLFIEQNRNSSINSCSTFTSSSLHAASKEQEHYNIARDIQIKTKTT